MHAYSATSLGGQVLVKGCELGGDTMLPGELHPARVKRPVWGTATPHDSKITGVVKKLWLTKADCIARHCGRDKEGQSLCRPFPFSKRGKP